MGDGTWTGRVTDCSLSPFFRLKLHSQHCTLAYGKKVNKTLLVHVSSPLNYPAYCGLSMSILFFCSKLNCFLSDAMVIDFFLDLNIVKYFKVLPYGFSCQTQEWKPKSSIYIQWIYPYEWQRPVNRNKIRKMDKIEHVKVVEYRFEMIAVEATPT